MTIKTHQWLTLKLLTEFGFTINQFNSIEQFEEVFKQNRFNLVLIDTDNSINLSEKIFDFAAKLKTFDTDVICFIFLKFL